MVQKSLTNILREINHLSLSDPNGALTQLLKVPGRVVRADTVVLNSYNEDEHKLQRPLVVGHILKPAALEKEQADLAARIIQERESYYVGDISSHPLFSRSFLVGEGIRSIAGLLLRIDSETVGALFFYFRGSHEFSRDEKAYMDLFAHEIGESLRIVRFGRKDGVELISPNILRVHIELPSLLTPEEYFDITADRLWAIQFIYLVFRLVLSGDSKTIKDFVALFGENPNEALVSKSQIRSLFASTSIDQLVLVSAHYGSPASFDLLGIGKIAEILRETIKDLLWRFKHEKKMAELERRSKGV